MKIPNFVLNLSRNLGTQLPALVGKALGRSGQLPSFKFFNPDTRTPPNGHFQQPAGEGKRKGKRGKEKKKKKKEKSKSNLLFRLPHVLARCKSIK